MPSSNQSSVVSIHVQDASIKKHDTSFQEPFKDVSNTFKAGFFTGAIATSALFASFAWILI